MSRRWKELQTNLDRAAEEEDAQLWEERGPVRVTRPLPKPIPGRRRELRVVHLQPQAGKPGTKTWGYTYEDLADLYGLSADQVKRAVYSGDLDPYDLQSVCSFWFERIREREYEAEDPYELEVNLSNRYRSFTFEVGSIEEEPEPEGKPRCGTTSLNWETKRRSVVVPPGTPVEGRPLLFAYGYRDFARLYNTSESYIRTMFYRGRVDPLDLRDIVRMFIDRCLSKAASSSLEDLDDSDG